MDAMTPEFVSGVEQGVAAVRARIAALREEIRRLEASIGGEPDYSTPKPPAADARALLPDRPARRVDDLQRARDERQHALDSNARQLAAFRRLGYGAVPPPPASDRETERAITETKIRTNQPTGAPSDIQALRELLRQGPGVASAR